MPLSFQVALFSNACRPPYALSSLWIPGSGLTILASQCDLFTTRFVVLEKENPPQLVNSALAAAPPESHVCDARSHRATDLGSARWPMRSHG